MSPLLIIDPREPLSIDSFEFLYQAIAKEISSIYEPVRDGLALLAGCYILKKLLPVPYYCFRTAKLYFFPYKLNAALLKRPVTTHSQSNDLSLPDHDEHWALINDCTTPSGCAFAQNLAVSSITFHPRSTQTRTLSFFAETRLQSDPRVHRRVATGTETTLVAHRTNLPDSYGHRCLSLEQLASAAGADLARHYRFGHVVGEHTTHRRADDFAEQVPASRLLRPSGNDRDHRAQRQSGSLRQLHPAVQRPQPFENAQSSGVSINCQQLSHPPHAASLHCKSILRRRHRHSTSR